MLSKTGFTHSALLRWQIDYAGYLQIGETKLDQLKAYIERYRKDNNDKMPTHTHLNNEFNMRSTKEFYKGVENETRGN